MLVHLTKPTKYNVLFVFFLAEQQKNKKLTIKSTASVENKLIQIPIFRIVQTIPIPKNLTEIKKGCGIWISDNLEKNDLLKIYQNKQSVDAIMRMVYFSAYKSYKDLFWFIKY